jgi:hypothetical protein
VQAPVEIRYEGAILAKGVAPTGSLEEGLFLPLADPMPVGTRLELRNERETHLVRVVKVTESAEAGHAGVSVKPAGHPEPVELLPEPEPVAPVIAAPAVPATPARPATPAAPPAHAPQGSNGIGKSAVAGTIGPSGPAPTAAASTETSDGVPEGIDGEDTGNTSEYPALSNGASGPKRRQKKRKPR